MPLQIYPGAKLYIVSERKYITVQEDLYVERIQEHTGHCRFPVNELTHALTYADNKGKYKRIQKEKSQKEEEITEDEN